MNHAEYMRIWRKNHPAYIASQRQNLINFRKRHPNYVKEYSSKWRKANPEKTLEQVIKWKKNHPDKVLEMKKKT